MGFLEPTDPQSPVGTSACGCSRRKRERGFTTSPLGEVASGFHLGTHGQAPVGDGRLGEDDVVHAALVDRRGPRHTMGTTWRVARFFLCKIWQTFLPNF